MHDAFLALIPQAPVPDSVLPEAEIIDLEDPDSPPNSPSAEDDNESDLPDVSDFAAEKIDLTGLNAPAAEVNNDFGGENCKCRCHLGQEPDRIEDGTHCLHCSLVFIQGKVFIRDGKSLKPGRLEYPSGQNPFAEKKKIETKIRRRQRKSSINAESSESMQ